MEQLFPQKRFLEPRSWQSLSSSVIAVAMNSIIAAVHALRRRFSMCKRRLWRFLLRNVYQRLFRSCRKKNPTTSLANSSQGHRLSSISISSINEFSTDQQTVFHEPDERRDHSTATERPSTTECPGTNSQLNGNIFQKKNSRQIRRLQFRNKSPETGQRSESISRSSLLLTRTRSIGSLGTSMLESNYFPAAPGISLKSDGSPHDQSNLPVQKTGPCPPQGSFSSFVSSFVCSNSGEGVGGWSTSVVSSPLCIVSSTPVKTK